MTSRERYLRVLNHQEADKIPMTDSPWGETINRWKNEGFPENVDISDYFGWDKMATYGGDWSLRLPGETIEETSVPENVSFSQYQKVMGFVRKYGVYC